MYCDVIWAGYQGCSKREEKEEQDLPPFLG